MATNCIDPAQMQLALLNNVIPQGTYTLWATNFFKSLPLPPAKIFDAGTIRTAINYNPNQPNCNSCIQMVSPSTNGNVDNSDIIFNVITKGSLCDDITVYYQMVLFNAFFAILDPIMPIASFGFTKATKPDGQTDFEFDIIFQTIFVDTTIAPLCWDLSGTVPTYGVASTQSYYAEV